MNDTMFQRIQKVAGPSSASFWIVSFILCVAATLVDESHLSRDFGRWGIWLALAAVALTFVHLTAVVTTRLVQILALFHDDVPLVEPKHAAV